MFVVVTTFYTLDGMKSILLPKFVFFRSRLRLSLKNTNLLFYCFIFVLRGCCTSYYNIPSSLPEGATKTTHRLTDWKPPHRHSEPWRRIQKAFLPEEGGAVGDGRRIRLSTPYIFVPNHACGVYGIRNPLRYGIGTQCRMASTQSVVWHHAICVYRPACISSVRRTVYHQCIALHITHAAYGISSRLCLVSPPSSLILDFLFLL